MERDFKNRPQGLIFYFVLFTMLFFSRQGTIFIQQLFSLKINQEILDFSNISIGIIGVGLTFFTSDTIGYIFTSLIYALFNLWGGYSRIYEKFLSYSNYKFNIIDLYQNKASSTNYGQIDADKFNARFPNMSYDTLFVYFFWCKDKQQDQLGDWVIRRTTAFFTNLSSILAILMALIISDLIITHNNLGYSYWNRMGLFCSIVTIVALLINGIEALKRSIEALDLLIAGSTNPRFKETLNKIYLPVDNK